MNIKVFIADDHAIVRDGLRSLLEANPAVTVVGDAADGRQAVELVIRLQPDVVVMDISMPELDGIAATRRVLDTLPQVQVIVLSMIGTPEHISRALQAGARGYLLKESAGREVLDAVLSVHAGNVYLSQPVLNTLIADYLQCRTQAENKGPLECLSEREREILQLVVQGKTSAEIAEMLFLSPKTVESYRSRMMHKLEVPNLSALIKLALEEGL
jgi:DNA-binding NarL/FixJ family response regulator